MKKIYLLLLMAAVQTGFAQTWFKLAGLSPNVIVKQLEISPTGTIYALTTDDYVFFSNTEGADWTPVTPPPFLSYLANARKIHLNENNGRLFVGTSTNGLSFTSNFGLSWGEQFFTTDPNTGLHESINNIASLGNKIVVSGNVNLAGPIQRYFYSTNNGSTWSAATQSFGISEDILLENNSWIVATSIGLQKTDDNGVTWNIVAFFGGTYSAHSILKDGSGNYYCIVKNNAFNIYEVNKSTNLTQWETIHSFSTANYYSVNYALQTNSLLLATEEGLLKLSLNTNAAATISSDVVTEAVEDVAQNRILYGSASNVGVQIGSAPDYSFASSTEGFVGTIVGSTDKFIIKNNDLYNITSYNRLVGRLNLPDSDSWTYSFTTDPENTLSAPNVFLDANATALFAGSSKNIYKSIDNGQSWQSVTNPLVLPFNTNETHQFREFRVGKNNAIFTAQDSDGNKVRMSTDDGATWQVIIDAATFQNLGLPMPIFYNNITADGNGKIYASYVSLSLQEKMITSVNGTTWTDATPAGFDALNSTDFRLEFDNDNVGYIVNGNTLHKIGAGNLAPVTVPWNVNDTSMLGLEIAFDAGNNLVVNLKGTEFCTACGVYKREGTIWDFYEAPDMLANTPLSGLALLSDGTPVVQTRYLSSQGSIEDMGYYYYRETELGTNDYTIGQFLLYPNPATSQINIKVITDGRLEIFNVLGQRVSEVGSIEAGAENSIDISAWQSGVYFAKFYSGGKQITKKFIVD